MFIPFKQSAWFLYVLTCSSPQTCDVNTQGTCYQCWTKNKPWKMAGVLMRFISEICIRQLFVEFLYWIVKGTAAHFSSIIFPFWVIFTMIFTTETQINTLWYTCYNFLSMLPWLHIQLKWDDCKLQYSITMTHQQKKQYIHPIYALLPPAISPTPPSWFFWIQQRPSASLHLTDKRLSPPMVLMGRCGHCAVQSWAEHQFLLILRSRSLLRNS